jgi:hypothetical protein
MEKECKTWIKTIFVKFIPFCNPCLEKSVFYYHFGISRTHNESDNVSLFVQRRKIRIVLLQIRDHRNFIVYHAHPPFTIVMTSVSLTRNPRAQWRQLVHKCGERSHGQNATARAKYESRRRLINATTLHF